MTNHQDKAKSVITTYESNITKVKDAVKNQQPARVAVLRATGKGVTAETDEAVTASMVKELGMTNVVDSHLEGTTKDKTVPYSLETLTADNPDIIFVVTMGKVVKRSVDTDEKAEDEGEVPDELPSTAESAESTSGR